MAKEIFCSIGVDVDAVAGWLGSYGGEDSPDDISRGMFAGEVGTRRLLKLFDRYDMQTTWFIPGHSIETFPEETQLIVEAGHEIGMHGWIHERTSPLPEDVERDLMARAFDTLTKATGQRPVGVRVPSWDFSPNTLKLIREMSLLYDSSLMADDEPYELVEDGMPTGVVELPVEWIKDDAPYLNMNRFEAIRPYTPPSAVLEIFRREFDGAVAEGGLFLLTMHPHIIGHRSRMAILEELVRHMKATPGVWFATHEEVARYCKEHA
jgi:peptidoglycan/xylan/chitin deacetylase (PgdA/CDA1 family)